MPPVSVLLTEQLNVAISPQMRRQLEAIEEKQGTTPPAYARIAITEKLSGESTQLAKAAAELRRLGGDPLTALRAAIDQLEQPSIR